MASPGLGEGHLQMAATHTGLGDVGGHSRCLGLPPERGPLFSVPPLGQAAPCAGKPKCVPVGPRGTQVSRNPPSPRSPPPNTHTLAIVPPWSPVVRHVPAKALVSVGQCRELNVCFLGIDSGPALLLVVEMCVCSTLSSSP